MDCLLFSQFDSAIVENMVLHHLTSHIKPYCSQEKTLECKGMETWIEISLTNLHSFCNYSRLLLLSCTIQLLWLSLDQCGSCFVTQLILNFLTSRNVSGSCKISDLLLFYTLFHPVRINPLWFIACPSKKNTYDKKQNLEISLKRLY